MNPTKRVNISKVISIRLINVRYFLILQLEFYIFLLLLFCQALFFLPFPYPFCIFMFLLRRVFHHTTQVQQNTYKTTLILATGFSTPYYYYLSLTFP